MLLLNVEVVERLTRRLRLPRWFPRRLLSALFVFGNGFIAVAILAALALVSHSPFVFPSVGPTAFLLYFTPLAPAASPRNTICGHAIGICCGYAALRLMSLENAPAASLEEIHWPRVLAAALSLALTGALMILAGVVHPPAGATTLIISLGFITAIDHLCVIEAAVVLLSGQAILVNRLMGIDYPIWSKPVAGAGTG